jgi:hypothetical protein
VSQFFFDYFDGERLHEAEDGVELRDVEAAYLEAFQAATDMWGEALKERRNPTLDYFRIRNRTGVVVLELPFTEVLESMRGGRLASSSKVKPPPKFAGGSTQRAVEFGWQHVLRGREIVAQQRSLVNRLKEQGRDTNDAEDTLGLFARSLAIFEDQLASLAETKRWVAS